MADQTYIKAVTKGGQESWITPQAMSVIADWDTLINKPSTFAPSTHGNSVHSETYITSAYVTWDNVASKPGTFAPSSHNNSAHSETYITAAALSPYAPLASPNFTENITLTGSLIGKGTTYLDIYTDTADGSDNKITRIGGGGDVAVSRGGFVTLYGNEAAGYGGCVRLSPGSGKWVFADGGLHIGGESDPGDNNLLADGWLHGTALKTTNYSWEEVAGSLVLKYGSTTIVEITSAGFIKALSYIGSRETL